MHCFVCSHECSSANEYIKVRGTKSEKDDLVEALRTLGVSCDDSAVSHNTVLCRSCYKKVFDAKQFVIRLRLAFTKCDNVKTVTTKVVALKKCCKQLFVLRDVTNVIPGNQCTSAKDTDHAYTRGECDVSNTRLDVEVLDAKQQATLLSAIDAQCFQLCKKNDESSVLRKLKGVDALASHHVILQIVKEVKSK